MGEVQVSVNEEGALEVQQYYLRLLRGRLRPEGFERHRVVTWPNCSSLFESVKEATFNRGLKVFFLVILTLAVINLIMFELSLTHHYTSNEASTWDYISDQTWLFGHFRVRQRGMVLLAMFTAVVVVGVFVKKTAARSPGSAPPKREQVQTMSAVLQQV